MREVANVDDETKVSMVFDHDLPNAACWTRYSHDDARCPVELGIEMGVELGIEMRKSVCHALAQPPAQLNLHSGSVSTGVKGHS